MRPISARGGPTGAVGDAIVHLAGLAAVGPSFDRPQEYLSGQQRDGDDDVRIDTAGGPPRHPRASASAPAPSTAPPVALRRSVGGVPVAFTSPYAVSKLLVENQLAYYRNRGMDTVVARPFNHIGPGQRPASSFPTSSPSCRVLPADGTLRVGNLATRRDYTDVRDVARAYLLLATAPSHENTLYNVASGVSRSGAWILERVCIALGRPVPHTEVDGSRIRATDPLEIVGDAGRMSREYAWSPQVPLERSIADAVALIVQ